MTAEKNTVASLITQAAKKEGLREKFTPHWKNLQKWGGKPPWRCYMDGNKSPKIYVEEGIIVTLKNNYGFIQPEQGGANIFFLIRYQQSVCIEEEVYKLEGHSASAEYTKPKVGERICFVREETERGCQALSWGLIL